jgi:glycogen debranching enzyme
MSESVSLAQQAQDVLKRNDKGLYTMPGPGLYPHQWLWDSCFIAIGIRHYDVERAKMELLSLLRGQWSNGMIPHIVFSGGHSYRRDQNFWRSQISPFAPDGVATSGITQPPMLAEAVVRIGELLPVVERRSWYRQVWPSLLAYHQWLFAERDPHGEGLTLQIHPWETGLDTTPPWMSEMHEHLLPWWVRVLDTTRLEAVVGWFRRDSHVEPHGKRYSTIDALAMFDAQRRLRRKAYNINRILDHSLFAIEDLSFNCIFIRANEHLLHIAKSLRVDVPAELIERITQGRKAFEDLWDPYTESYYSRDFITHRLLKEPSVAGLLPLYAGCITKERADLLVKSLENEHTFGPPYPVPSTPLNSSWFKPNGYWQGPTWFNINWLIIDGLRRYGYHDHADALVEVMTEMAGQHGFREYYNPLDGEGHGSRDFSWTASLMLDLLKKGKA